jgi:hypothetical protein
MPVQRLYIYRCGETNICALTGQKGEPRLPAPLASDHWQFWMQTSSHQTDNGVYSFALECAAPQIAARGYYLFRGSKRLLDGHVSRSCDEKRSAVDLKTQATFARCN